MQDKKANVKEGIVKNMHRNVIGNFLWRFAERSGAQFISFVVSIVLARILDAELYGTVAIMSVLIAILQVFVDSGLGNALIQKKDADDVDFSSVFYANIVTCLALYLLLFGAAPLIADFYNDTSMIPMIRVLGITVVIAGIKNVQQAYISKNFLFKKFFFATLGGTVCAAVVGIYMALSGYGAWALIMQQIVNVTIDTCIIWWVVEWRPRKVFSWSRLKRMYAYGWKLLVSSLVDTVYNKLRELLIGKVYTKADLAFYERGHKFPEIIVSNIDTSIDSILFPLMSESQDNREKVKAMTRRALQTSVYIMAPFMMGLAFAANTIVSVVLGEKWLFCVPYMRVFCITYMFYPIHTANLNAIKALGHPGLYLKLEIIKKVIGIVLLVITLKISVMAMTYVLLLSSFLSQLINSWPNRKLLGYKYSEQLKDICPSIMLAFFMGVIVLSIGQVNINVYMLLLIQIVSGAFIYMIGSRIFKLQPYTFVIEFLRQWRGKSE